MRLISDICVFTAPVFAGFTALATYLLTSELWNTRAGLLAAVFMSIAPGYTQRSVAGSFDNEGIAIFALQITFYAWLKAAKSGSVMWSVVTGDFNNYFIKLAEITHLKAFLYWYMTSAWGGYVFIINMIALHAFILILSKQYSEKLYVSYTTTYLIGQLMAMNIPFVGFQPVETSEHMAGFGVFGLIQLAGIHGRISNVYGENTTRKIYIMLILTALFGGLAILVTLVSMGVIAPFTGRFYSLWDTAYARAHLPLISSVSEHQPTPWLNYFTDCHALPIFALAGLWYIIEVNF